jgi:hypothetical protein
MLRRWILIVLLACLPLQGSLALALGYCQHESDAAGQQQTHAGHHEHQHEAKAKVAGDAQADAAALEHGDCAQCHFGCSLGLASDCAAPLPAMGQALWALVSPPRAGLAPDAIERVPLALPTSASY